MLPVLPSSSNTQGLSVVEQAQSSTIQSHVRKNPETGGVSFVHWMAKAGLYLSPWWSPGRDRQLREFWKKTDHLSGAVFTMTAKMTAIPFKIVPRNTQNREHIIQADEMTEYMRSAAQFGEGWTAFYSRFVEDLITQDNGAFAEIIGPGSPTGPLTGAPVTVAHLDSARCTRTGNPEFPVVYRDENGKSYKLHYSRVLYTAQQASPIAEMNGVGFCSVSRCVNVSQNILDILTFKQEKLGSRPHRAIVITKGGLDPQDIRLAFQAAESETDSMGASRYSKVVVAGSSSIEEADLKLIELSSLPEGFDEQTSIMLGMAAIALAFGVDARELFPAMTAGATRADALLQHLKQRGKGPGQILEVTEQLFNHKFLPPHLKMVFDFQDDAEDRQIADIKKVRSERRNLDISAGTIDDRIAREQMLETGDINRAQFEWLELDDGRLPDGSPVVSLFYSKDTQIRKFLDLGIPDPLDVDINDSQAVISAIQRQFSEINRYIATAQQRVDKWPAIQALAALKSLKKMYEEQHFDLNQESGLPNAPGAQIPANNVFPRGRFTRRQELTNPNVANESNPPEDLQPSGDDKVE